MQQFEVGDIIQLPDNFWGQWRCAKVEILKVISINQYQVRHLETGEVSPYNEDGNSILIKSKNNMNIKEKFALALTKEPMKSFRKAGITNGDNLLTEDGMKIFLSWLLDTKYADEFKTDVVDAMISDKEEETK